MPFLFILSGITIEKAALAFPSLNATVICRLCQTKIYHYIFCHSHSYFLSKKKNENERERKKFFFFAPFVWIWLYDSECVEIARNVIQFTFSGPLSYRSAIVLLSSRFFHLQFIKINSYRYFGYGRTWRKENNTSAAMTTPHKMKSGRKSHFVPCPGIQDLVGLCLYIFVLLDEKTCWSQNARCYYCVCVNGKGKKSKWMQ